MITNSLARKQNPEKLGLMKNIFVSGGEIKLIKTLCCPLQLVGLVKQTLSLIRLKNLNIFGRVFLPPTLGAYNHVIFQWNPAAELTMWVYRFPFYRFFNGATGERERKALFMRRSCTAVGMA